MGQKSSSPTAVTNVDVDTEPKQRSICLKLCEAFANGFGLGPKRRKKFPYSHSLQSQQLPQSPYPSPNVVLHFIDSKGSTFNESVGSSSMFPDKRQPKSKQSLLSYALSKLAIFSDSPRPKSWAWLKDKSTPDVNKNTSPLTFNTFRKAPKAQVEDSLEDESHPPPPMEVENEFQIEISEDSIKNAKTVKTKTSSFDAPNNYLQLIKEELAREIPSTRRKIPEDKYRKNLAKFQKIMAQIAPTTEEDTSLSDYDQNNNPIKQRSRRKASGKLSRVIATSKNHVEVDKYFMNWLGKVRSNLEDEKKEADRAGSSSKKVNQGNNVVVVNKVTFEKNELTATPSNTDSLATTTTDSKTSVKSNKAVTNPQSKTSATSSKTKLETKNDLKTSTTSSESNLNDKNKPSKTSATSSKTKPKAKNRKSSSTSSKGKLKVITSDLKHGQSKKNAILAKDKTKPKAKNRKSSSTSSKGKLKVITSDLKHGQSKKNAILAKTNASVKSKPSSRTPSSTRGATGKKVKPSCCGKEKGCFPSAPPAYLDYSAATRMGCCRGGGSSRKYGGGVMERIKNVDVVEELTYMVPNECGDGVGVGDEDDGCDYYAVCESCGEMEPVTDELLKKIKGTDCKNKCETTPVTYSRRQRFNFRNNDDPDDEDGPPYPYEGLQCKNCPCLCCVAGLRRNPNCDCNCCKTKGRARRCSSFDEHPVGTNPQIRRILCPEEESKMIREECDKRVPKDSGMYRFDEKSEKFVRVVPRTPSPIILEIPKPRPLKKHEIVAATNAVLERRKPPTPPPPPEPMYLPPIFGDCPCYPPCCAPNDCCAQEKCNAEEEDDNDCGERDDESSAAANTNSAKKETKSSKSKSKNTSKS